MCWRKFFVFSLVIKECEKKVKNSHFFKWAPFWNLIFKKKKKKKTITFFRRKLSKLHKKDNFVCGNCIFPKTKANKNKQWTHYSALKCLFVEERIQRNDLYRSRDKLLITGLMMIKERTIQIKYKLKTVNWCVLKCSSNNSIKGSQLGAFCPLAIVLLLWIQTSLS